MASYPHDFSKIKLCIIGLGYVGLPLAIEFGKQYNTLGYDIDDERVLELKHGKDHTMEINNDEFLKAGHLEFTSDSGRIQSSNVYIITVPTPIDRHNSPNLNPLIRASETVGRYLASNDTVIYESTVYPGATEEECVPVLEKASGLRHNKDFFTGYSPERINPGDQKHRVIDIKKVTSGSTPKAAEFVDQLYKSIIRAGTHRASSIKVAEAAKVIENTQRDLNIALTNELAIIFNKLEIDTEEVLKAAGTKWNFLPFRPGLVGGHCIGVDPYYLTYKAQAAGYHPEIILAGRRLNDGMASYVVSQLVKLMIRKGVHVNGAKVLVMGLSFKANCPDLRNTKVIDVIHELQDYQIEADVHDPWVNARQAHKIYGISPVEDPEQGAYDAIILAVAHEQFQSLGEEGIRQFGKPECLIYDLKYLLPPDAADLRL